MTEEEYAKLLALSAKRTNIAIISNQRAIEGKPPLQRFVLPFCEIRKKNNHDIKVFLQEFASLSGLTIDVLMSRNRTAMVSNTRNIMFYVMHKYLSFSTPQISKIFGRDVSTIQSGKARGQYIVDRNKFLVGLIEDAINKSRIKEEQ